MITTIAVGLGLMILSAWAIFKAGGGDAPHYDEVVTFLRDLRKKPGYKFFWVDDVRIGSSCKMQVIESGSVMISLAIQEHGYTFTSNIPGHEHFVKGGSLDENVVRVLKKYSLEGLECRSRELARHRA